MIPYKRIHELESEKAVQTGVSLTTNIALSIWHNNREAPWEVVTDASDYLSFDIIDEGNKWGNGLIIDMDPYMTKDGGK